LGTIALYYNDACAVYVVIDYLALLLYCRHYSSASHRRPVHMGFVMEKVALVNFMFKYFDFFLSLSFH
jgi:hypothetical protein